jgi:hypothetical protein
MAALRSPTQSLVSETEMAAFARDGYVFVRGLFDPTETGRINEAVNTEPNIAASVLRLADSKGGGTEIALWRTLDDDSFGAVCRCDRVVERVEVLLDGPTDFYYAKLTLKKPRVGGSWD